MARNRWTQEDTELARRLLAANAPEWKFRKELGRSYSAAKHRIKWVDDPSVRRATSERVQRQDRSKRGGQHPVVPRMAETKNGRAPLHLLDERDARNLADRTIGQALLGDPLPGRSALDRKLSSLVER